jgi:hypothetical protein
MAGTPKLLSSPAYIAASAANIFTPAGGSALLYDIVRHIHVANVTNAAATFSLYIGATGGSAGGTELAKILTVAAYSCWDWYGALKLISTTFMSGICETGASKLVITVEGEQSVV